MGLFDKFSRKRPPLDGRESGQENGVSPIASELSGNTETLSRQKLKL